LKDKEFYMKNLKELDLQKRPLILELNEAKTEIADSINRAIARGIPCFLLQDIVNGFANQISSAAAQELAAAQAQEQKGGESDA